MAKNEGKKFEEDWKNSVPDNVFIERINDTFYSGVVNIADFIMYAFPNLFLLELKSVKGRSIPFSRLNGKQLKMLEVASKKKGVRAGFLFNFREVEQTYYINVHDVIDYIRTADRKSFPLDWCKEKGLLVKQTKKISRYKYHVSELLGVLSGE